MLPHDGEIDLGRTVHSLPLRRPGDGNRHRLPVLVVLRGAQVGRRYLLNENELVLGRNPDRADLVVPGDPQISSQHCRVERGTGQDSWRIVDLASTNGTLLGGARVTAAGLSDGDRIHLGETVLKFCFHDELEEEFHRQVDHLMNLDDLTGLPVQRVHEVRLQEALAACARQRAPLAVYMMDMDGLKKINDMHGHLFGAHTIATVGRRLGAILQEHGGSVSRFGGDEFSAFAPNADRARALELGEVLRAAVAGEPIVQDRTVANPTISIGLAAFPDDGRLSGQLTRQADAALYRAKAAGRNRVST
jgi:diguanylate cyclase (GGDEF)-like protein